MTRAKMYEELKGDGVKLRAIGSMRYDEIAALYKERFGVDPGVDKSGPESESTSDAAGEVISEKHPVRIAEKAVVAEVASRLPTLVFSESGWCEALKRSYFRGNYRPKSRDEYLALRKFASKEI